MFLPTMSIHQDIVDTTITNRSRRNLNILFIKSMNHVGAFINLNNITKNSYCPYLYIGEDPLQHVVPSGSSVWRTLGQVCGSYEPSRQLAFYGLLGVCRFPRAPSSKLLQHSLPMNCLGWPGLAVSKAISSYSTRELQCP